MKNIIYAYNGQPKRSALSIQRLVLPYSSEATQTRNDGYDCLAPGSSSQKRSMLARDRWTGMDEPNSTSRDDWAAALRRAHFLVFFSGAKGLEDAHGRGAGEAFAAGEPSSRELCAQWLTERQSSSRRCSGCTGSRPRPCASSTAIRHGTRRGRGEGRRDACDLSLQRAAAHHVADQRARGW